MLKVLDENKVGESQVSLVSGKVLIIAQEDSTKPKLIQFCTTFDKLCQDDVFTGDRDPLLVKQMHILTPLVTSTNKSPAVNLARALASDQEPIFKALAAFPRGREVISEAEQGRRPSTRSSRS